MAPCRKDGGGDSGERVVRSAAQCREMVGPGRLELPTLRLSGVRSNHLSYGPPRSRRRVRPWARDRARHLTATSEWKEKRRRRRSALFDAHRQAGASVSLNVPIDREIWRNILRKEVIQPQVPLRLPCYDFTPVADPTVVACLLAVSAAPSGKANSHGVTGGVYKARERIHRGMLIRDY